jgi:hypothetical protein
MTYLLLTPLLIPLGLVLFAGTGVQTKHHSHTQKRVKGKFAKKTKVTQKRKPIKVKHLEGHGSITYI